MMRNFIVIASLFFCLVFVGCDERVSENTSGGTQVETDLCYLTLLNQGSQRLQANIVSLAQIVVESKQDLEFTSFDVQIDLEDELIPDNGLYLCVFRELNNQYGFAGSAVLFQSGDATIELADNAFAQFFGSEQSAFRVLLWADFLSTNDIVSLQVKGCQVGVCRNTQEYVDFGFDAYILHLTQKAQMNAEVVTADTQVDAESWLTRVIDVQVHNPYDEQLLIKGSSLNLGLGDYSWMVGADACLFKDGELAGMSTVDSSQIINFSFQQSPVVLLPGEMCTFTFLVDLRRAVVGDTVTFSAAVWGDYDVSYAQVVSGWLLSEEFSVQ